MSSNTATQTGRDTPAGNHESAYRIAARSAAVALVFSLIVCALLLYDYSLRRPDDPLESPPIKALRALVIHQPDNEELNEEFRLVDRQLRQEWQQRQRFSYFGGWLLLAGVAVFLIAAKSAATLRRQLPTPQPQASPQDVESQWTRAARWSVAALCVLLVGVAVGLGLMNRSEVNLDNLAESPGPDSPGIDPGPPPPPPPKPEEIAKWWPRFRGPGGSGVSAYTNVPDSWDDKTDKNIRWKTPVPLPGMNSPVVWDKRVFLTGATADRREVYCFDADSGKILWQQDVPASPLGKLPMKEPEFTGYAAPTAVTDGRWVFAMFGNGDVVAFDYDGNRAWVRGLGIPENPYGHSASLAMFGNLLLVQLDQGTRRDAKSKLLALDVTQKGKTAWEVPREVGSCWPSPIVIRHDDRHQVITCADPWVIAYAPTDGTELWRAKVLRQDVGPSPIYVGGLVYVANEWPQLSAIRPDGQGDVTETHVAWIGEDGLPQSCGPLATQQYVLLLIDGTLTCYDAKVGGMLWEEYEAFDAVAFTSSPSLADGRVYLFGELDKEDETDEEGYPLKYCKTWILEPGPDGCKIVGTCELDEGCVTSPALLDGRIYIRGEKHLYCLEEEN